MKDNLKERCVWKYYLFFIINGLKPKFEGMNYILMKEVYKISQVQLGIIMVLAASSSLFGLILFQSKFKYYEMRHLQYATVGIAVVFETLGLLQVLRWNVRCDEEGNCVDIISDFALICCGGIVLAPLVFSMSLLPALVMFQKLTPGKVEATMFAFAMSIVNSGGMLGNFTGYLVNENFVGVDKDHLSQFYKL